MMGKAAEREGRLFYTGFSLDERVPPGHVLRLVDAAVDFSFVRRRVAHLYGRNGQVSLDPALLMRLMFLLYFENVRSERQLMRQLPMRLDWLWFCRLDLDSDIPDHSVLSKARRRFGVELFEKLFEHVLRLCEEAGLVGGDTAHADSTLLKASASKDKRLPRKLWEQLEHGLRDDDDAHNNNNNNDDGDINGSNSDNAASAQTPVKHRLNERVVSPADPDAATHTRRGVGTVLGYRDHRLVDDYAGVILATHATPADADDAAQLPTLLEQARTRLDITPREVVGDGQYGTRDNYELCASLKIKAYLKKRRGKDTPRISWLSLLPAGCTRRRAVKLMSRRKCVAEGSFADAHERHGHKRCRWRRLGRVRIGCLLVAAVQNIKKLIKPRPRPALRMRDVIAGAEPARRPRTPARINPRLS